jgi:hypothetical protein
VLHGNLGMSRVDGAWTHGLALALAADLGADFEDLAADETLLLFESARSALDPLIP